MRRRDFLTAAAAAPAALANVKAKATRIRIRKAAPLLMKGPTRSTTLVMARISTDQGLEGVGECFAWRTPDRSLRLPRMIAAVGEAIAGTNPLDINAFLLRFREHPPKNDNPTPLEWASALAAIEIALWDIAGQVAGLPIYKLLGGAVRESVPVYVNHGVFATARTSEERLERAIEVKAQGFQMFKWDPFRAWGNPDADVIRKEIREVALFRDRFGADFPLAIDAHARYHTPAAMVAAKELEPFKPVFFEEPVRPTDFDGYRQVARNCSIPIATGERLATLRDTREILDTGAIKVLQLEPGNFCGILDTFHACAMAQTYGAQIAPHDWCGPVLTRATTHICAAIPNLLRQEYPPTAREDAWENDILIPPTVVRDGAIVLPEGPGLGSKLNEKLLASRRVDA